ncbi:mycoredoxin [Austwickia chelonae]|uniref:mycoredoxin n=1 Tax=Austwickia chelonae TaxID=100225 RepID=UPI000E249084|nr:mycoredoxin [Austwickia chelonae]
MTKGHLPTPGAVTVYATGWCPFCTRLRRNLDDLGVDYDLIDIDTDTQAAAFVEHVNGGNRTVPTVLFADGGTLTNPIAEAVQARATR